MLTRTTLAVMAMMQVMMFALPGYAGCIAIAAALEVGSIHPIADALRGIGCRCLLLQQMSVPTRSPWATNRDGSLGSHLPIRYVRTRGRSPNDCSRWASVSLLSGDRDETVRHIAKAVGITTYRGDARPEDKRAHIAALQSDGAVVAMVGDGINDAPSLAQANVSLSFGSAATLTQWTADVVVLGDDLERVGDAIVCARRAFSVIRQNFAWAIAYNLVAIPLAATGHLTPLAATRSACLCPRCWSSPTRCGCCAVNPHTPSSMLYRRCRASP